MVGHPGYAIARQPYPSTDRKRRCVACRAAGDELAYCIGALSLGGAHWSQQGDVCEPCAVRLIGWSTMTGQQLLRSLPYSERTA